MTEADKNYEEYIERFCEYRRISREEAEKHAMVREIKKYYEEMEGSLK